jgi:hypothetical protein
MPRLDPGAAIRTTDTMSSLRHASQNTANLVIRHVQAHKGTRHDMRRSALTKQTVYDKLKRVIPGVPRGTSIDELDLRLKKEQSNPNVVTNILEF